MEAGLLSWFAWPKLNPVAVGLSSTFASDLTPNGLVEGLPKLNGEEAEVGVAVVPKRAPPFDVPNVNPVDITGLDPKLDGAVA